MALARRLAELKDLDAPTAWREFSQLCTDEPRGWLSVSDTCSDLWHLELEHLLNEGEGDLTDELKEIARRSFELYLYVMSARNRRSSCPQSTPRKMEHKILQAISPSNDGSNAVSSTPFRACLDFDDVDSAVKDHAAPQDRSPARENREPVSVRLGSLGMMHPHPVNVLSSPRLVQRMPSGLVCPVRGDQRLVPASLSPGAVHRVVSPRPMRLAPDSPGVKRRGHVVRTASPDRRLHVSKSGSGLLRRQAAPMPVGRERVDVSGRSTSSVEVSLGRLTTYARPMAGVPSFTVPNLGVAPRQASIASSPAPDFRNRSYLPPPRW